MKPFPGRVVEWLCSFSLTVSDRRCTERKRGMVWVANADRLTEGTSHPAGLEPTLREITLREDSVFTVSLQCTIDTEHTTECPREKTRLKYQQCGWFES